MQLKVVYEDTELLVCEKPSGFPVQSRRIGEKDCVSELKIYLHEQNPDMKEPYLGLIHRLDQPVQGLLVFAKTKQAAANLSAQLTGNGFVKEYEAVVLGKMQNPSGRLVDYLKKNGKTNSSAVVDKDTPDAKRAELRYRVLQEKDGCSLVEVHLLTGRHHQIRVQMANAGCPLYGDRKYGFSGEMIRGKETIGLCAVRLSFCHPKTKKKMEFICRPTGACFAQFQEDR